MSRAAIVLVLVLVVIVAGLVWLSRAPVEVPPHRIEKTVTLGGAGDAAS